MPKLVKPVDTNLNNTEMDDTASVQVKVPKRILHFCDGTLEEYSDDELEQADVKQPEPVVDPVSSYSHRQMAHNTPIETAIDSTLGVSCMSKYSIFILHKKEICIYSLENFVMGSMDNPHGLGSWKFCISRM